MGVSLHGSKFSSTPIEADSNIRFAYGLFISLCSDLAREGGRPASS